MPWTTQIADLIDCKYGQSSIQEAEARAKGEDHKTDDGDFKDGAQLEERVPGWVCIWGEILMSTVCLFMKTTDLKLDPACMI